MGVRYVDYPENYVLCSLMDGGVLVEGMRRRL